MNNPLVSIIIPVYNAEKYLEETILSAIAQTWTNKEIIIVDDGSTDNSLKIARKYENNLVKVLSQQNKGASAARNTGLKEAKGEYIQFLDADDLLSIDKINNQIMLLKKNPNKVAICSIIHFFDGISTVNLSPSPYEETFITNNDDPVHFLISLLGGFTKNGSMITIHSWLTPKNIIDQIGLWDEELNVDDDGEFFTRVVLNSKGVIKSQGWCYYRKYTSLQNLSSQQNTAGLSSRLKAILSKKRHLLAINNSFEAQAAIYKALINLAVDCYLKHPEIYRKAIGELPLIKTNYRPTIGGKTSNSLAAILGWKTIRFLKQMINK